MNILQFRSQFATFRAFSYHHIIVHIHISVGVVLDFTKFSL